MLRLSDEPQCRLRRSLTNITMPELVDQRLAARLLRLLPFAVQRLNDTATDRKILLRRHQEATRLRPDLKRVHLQASECVRTKRRKPVRNAKVESRATPRFGQSSNAWRISRAMSAAWTSEKPNHRKHLLSFISISLKSFDTIWPCSFNGPLQSGYSVWRRASIDWNQVGGTCDFVDTTSPGNSHEMVGICYRIERWWWHHRVGSRFPAAHCASAARTCCVRPVRSALSL